MLDAHALEECHAKSQAHQRQGEASQPHRPSQRGIEPATNGANHAHVHRQRQQHAEDHEEHAHELAGALGENGLQHGLALRHAEFHRGIHLVVGAHVVPRGVTRRGSSALRAAKGARSGYPLFSPWSHGNKVPVGCVIPRDLPLFGATPPSKHEPHERASE